MVKEKINIVWIKRDLRSQDHEPFFFAENDKIDHVAISLGESKIIHCSGFVKEESLKSTDSDYNMKLNTKFYGAISIEELS